jgi:hypothetical protein
MGQRGGRDTAKAAKLGKRLLSAVVLAVVGAAAWSAPIYTCIDANGKKLTSDRPIPECTTRDQRVLNADGSIKQVVPPTLTSEERAEQEARERQAAAERAQQQDAIRRDRNLVARFPTEAAHNKARNAALDDVKASLQRSERRLADLATERKPLLDEAEFYIGKPMPAKLKQQLEANDTATEAAHVLSQNQQAEIVRINALYDAELARLRRLWAGAPAGSMGGLPPALAASGPSRKTAAP